MYLIFYLYKIILKNNSIKNVFSDKVNLHFSCIKMNLIFLMPNVLIFYWGAYFGIKLIICIHSIL